MNIIYLCQYFLPEPAAPSARLYDLSNAWEHAGHKVTVLTGMPNHPTGVVFAEINKEGKPAYIEFICSQYPIYGDWITGTHGE